MGAASPIPELGFNAVGNSIYFNSVNLDSRVSVARQSLGAPGIIEDTFEVAFVGSPSEASIVNPIAGAGGVPLLFTNQEGIWTIQVNAEKQLNTPFTNNFRVRSAIPVIQIGDQLSGQLVTSLAIHDAIGNVALTSAGTPRSQRRGDHQVAFWASTGATQLIVRAQHIDSDEDGLLDHWETDGVDIDRDGAIDLDLQAMGANPFVRDIFLEIDELVDRTNGVTTPWSNELAPGVGQRLVTMFAAAPALSNGISAGIKLHLDAGPGNDANGTPKSFNMGSNSNMQGGDKIGQAGNPNTHIDVVYFGLPGTISVPGVETRDFGSIKNSYFGTTDKRARELVFHYAVFADFHSFLNQAGTPFVGTASTSSSLGITSSVPLPLGSGGTPDLSGDAIMITSGPAAGQLRIIASNTATTLSVTEPWSISPAGGTFVLLNGSSGLGEMSWRDLPDANTIPGNDLLLTLGGFGVHDDGWLGNLLIQWRTIAHELGHNLGLRHGGNDFETEKDPAIYQSLMSYSHQLSEVSNVQSYSGASDQTFNDWANLRMDFNESIEFLGRTVPGRSLEGSNVDNFDSFTVADYVLLNNGPVDLSSPTVNIAYPSQGSTVAAGSPLVVELTASDDRSVEQVEVIFDANGDGVEESYVAQLIGVGMYRVQIPTVSGPPGNRMLNAVASDRSLNIAHSAITIIVQSSTTPVPGDFDFDGDVDGADFVAWQTNFPKPSGATLADGDADGDGDVDGADFVVWQTNFPYSPSPSTIPGSTSGSSAIAPENSSADGTSRESLEKTPVGPGGAYRSIGGSAARPVSPASRPKPLSFTSAVDSRSESEAGARSSHFAESLQVGEIIQATTRPTLSASKIADTDNDRGFAERDDFPLAPAAVDYWLLSSNMYRSRSVGRAASISEADVLATDWES